jgi:peptidoglycan/LPS O-acetylase OafA/YrhL
MITNPNKLQNVWPIILNLAKDVFGVSLVSYLVFFLIDQIKQGFVSDFFNLNYILGVAVVSGIISAFSKEKEKEVKPLTIRDYIFIIVLAIIGAAIIFYKTQGLGWLSWLVSAVAGVLIVIVSILLLSKDEKEN